MRVLLISETGYGIGLSSRIQHEGHHVQIAVRNGSPVGHGIFEYIKDSPNPQRPDLVIYDEDSYGRSADEDRKTGYKVLGASKWAKTISEDSSYQKSLIQSLGWPLEGISTGTHIYISAWFNGSHFISSQVSFVYRRLMAGGCGPDIGCAGMLGCFLPQTDLAYHTFLKPLIPMLRKVNHRGCFHIHALVKGSDFCVKEVSASFNHPLALLLFENTNLSAADVLMRLFDDNSQEVRISDTWASGVLISTPPFPYTLDHSTVELKGIVKMNLKHLWLADVQRTKDGRWLSAGSSGYIGFVTARAPTYFECPRRMQKTLTNLNIPDVQYRNDVGRNIQGLVTGLQDSGWLNKGG